MFLNEKSNVLSRYKVPSRNLVRLLPLVSYKGACMTKLNKGKIRWIVKHWELRELSHWQIAKQQNITKQYALRVFKRFKDAKRPTLSLPGRQPKPFTQEEIESVKETYV